MSTLILIFLNHNPILNTYYSDTLEKNMGGFEACPGLHLEFEEWTTKRLPNPIIEKKEILQRNSKLNTKAKQSNQKIKKNKESLLIESDDIKPLYHGQLPDFSLHCPYLFLSHFLCYFF
jgi:hypothetical protein